MDTFKITFNDGSIHEYKKGTTFYEISKDFKMDNIVAFKVNNEVFPLDKEVVVDSKIEFINTDDIIGNRIYKSGLKFLFEVALKEMFPESDVYYEHSVPRGILGIIMGNKILVQDDIAKIKEKMCEIINANDIFYKLNITPKDAISFYKKKNEKEKASNIQNISDKIVCFYKLRGKFNYYYSIMPYSTESLNKFELVYLGNNKIVLLFPTTRSNGNVPEYVHYGNIIDSFYEGKTWLNNLQVPYVPDLNYMISNGKIKEFIRSNEISFNLKISKVVEEIINKKDIKFVLIAGPSSSGKTTTCERLGTYFEAQGYKPIKIGLDDYFLNREDTPKDEFGNFDFESVDAIDISLFNSDLKKILNGEEVILPKFNFITGKREISKKRVKLEENSIFLIEGLHALNEVLTESIESKFKYKIYLSPFIPINIDKHNYVSTIDLRLLRRIVRDNRTRGYSIEETIDNWQRVRDGEEKNIFPFIHQADIIINTALAYEVGVLKVYVEPLLLSVSVESTYYEEARRLIDFLKQFFPIPGEYINDESILREFIGGRYND